MLDTPLLRLYHTRAALIWVFWPHFVFKVQILALSLLEEHTQPTAAVNVAQTTKLPSQVYACLCTVHTSDPSMSLLLSLSKAVNTAPSSPGPRRTRKFIKSCARNAVGSSFVCVWQQQVRAYCRGSKKSQKMPEKLKQACMYIPYMFNDIFSRRLIFLFEIMSRFSQVFQIRRT